MTWQIYKPNESSRICGRYNRPESRTCLL